jgi:hypothetical protein
MTVDKDDAPPYSPTADYQVHLIEDEESTLMRSRAGTNPHAASTLEDHRNALRPRLTAPPTFFPSEPPPDYAPVDAPLIYATQTSNTPR